MNGLPQTHKKGTGSGSQRQPNQKGGAAAGVVVDHHNRYQQSSSYFFCIAFSISLAFAFTIFFIVGVFMESLIYASISIIGFLHTIFISSFLLYQCRREDLIQLMDENVQKEDNLQIRITCDSDFDFDAQSLSPSPSYPSNQQKENNNNGDYDGDHHIGASQTTNVTNNWCAKMIADNNENKIFICCSMVQKVADRIDNYCLTDIHKERLRTQQRNNDDDGLNMRRARRK